MADPATLPTNPVPVTSQVGALVEMCAGVIKQLSDLFASGQPVGSAASADDLGNRFLDQLRGFEGRAQRQGLALEDVHLAKYALVALIDEAILLSDLPVKDDWLGRPLALRCFDDLSAGEEFYNKLDKLRARPNSAQVDVLEVYHLCLAFGFRGKYGDQRGQEQRRRLIDSLSREINQYRGVNPQGPLSPKAESPEALSVPGRGWFALSRGPLWVMPVVMLALVVALYLVYALILAGSISGFATPPTSTATGRSGGTP